MNPCITQFKNQLAQYDAKCGVDEDMSVLELLWYCYSASSPVDDGRIQKAEDTLAPVFEELSFESSEMLFDRISELCTAYRCAAFLAGVKVGACLADELK